MPFGHTLLTYISPTLNVQLSGVYTMAKNALS